MVFGVSGRLLLTVVGCISDARAGGDVGAVTAFGGRVYFSREPPDRGEDGGRDCFSCCCKFWVGLRREGDNDDGDNDEGFGGSDAGSEEEEKE